jgi:hypothetical protein
MTGPDTKVYDSIHSFQQQSIVQQQANRQNFNVRALTENLDHLLLSAKNEIHLNNDHLQDLKNKTTAMERDKIEIEKYVEDASANLNRVEGVMNLVKRYVMRKKYSIITFLDLIALKRVEWMCWMSISNCFIKLRQIIQPSIINLTSTV